MSLESFKLDWVLVGNWWKILDDVEFPLRIVVNILGWMDKDISILCFLILDLILNSVGGKIFLKISVQFMHVTVFSNFYRMKGSFALHKSRVKISLPG